MGICNYGTKLVNDALKKVDLQSLMEPNTLIVFKRPFRFNETCFGEETVTEVDAGTFARIRQIHIIKNDSIKETAECVIELNFLSENPVRMPSYGDTCFTSLHFKVDKLKTIINTGFALGNEEFEISTLDEVFEVVDAEHEIAKNEIRRKEISIEYNKTKETRSKKIFVISCAEIIGVAAFIAGFLLSYAYSKIFLLLMFAGVILVTEGFVASNIFDVSKKKDYNNTSKGHEQLTELNQIRKQLIETERILCNKFISNETFFEKN